MNAADTIVVGRRLPRIRSVAFHAGFEVVVSWADATRSGATEIVDLSPLVFRLKFYAPLRDDEALCRSVHIRDGGAAIAWGEAEEIDMAAGSVLRLAEEARAGASLAGDAPDPSGIDGRTAAA